jgi:SAM-dependent methyltransferase
MSDAGPEEIFTWIFRTNHWGSSESVSGRGAELRQTVEVRHAVASVLNRYAIRSVVDAGCGDLNWQRRVPALLHTTHYLGVDVVADLVARNRERYRGTKARFAHLDITQDALPRADLVICRDCMVHLTNAQVLAVLRNVAMSGSGYLLATTYPAETFNRDTTDSHWRPINLMAEPYLLPEPIEFFDTDYRDNGRNHPGNGLGLWPVDRIPGAADE